MTSGETPDEPALLDTLRTVHTLHCLLGAEGCRSFAYLQLDSNSIFRAEKEGQIIQLRFAGSKLWEITICGLNLWKLHDGIHRHVILFCASGSPTGALPQGQTESR